MSYDTDKYKIAVAVFAGGRSVRMGIPKESIVIEGDGRTFLERICDEANACEQTLISGKYLSVRRGQRTDTDGFTAVEDEYDDIGPLGGLVTVLGRAKEDGMDAVLIVAVDMVKYDRHEIEEICRAYAGEDILIPRTADGRVHPLAGIYSVRLLESARRLADEGNYRMSALQTDDIHIKYYDTASDDAYLNVNRPEDLSTIKQACGVDRLLTL